MIENINETITENTNTNDLIGNNVYGTPNENDELLPINVFGNSSIIAQTLDNLNLHNNVPTTANLPNLNLY